MLADAIREVYPDGPDVLIGHSLGADTALALLQRQPDWARDVILEEPASVLAPEVCLAVAEGLGVDVVAVRDDRRRVIERVRQDHPGWVEEDVKWAVQGIAEMDAAPFAERFSALAHDERLRLHTPNRIVAAAPAAYVLAGDTQRSFLDGGSALSRVDREEIARRLPAGHVIAIDGGHCLHRDAPANWLAAVVSIID